MVFGDNREGNVFGHDYKEGSYSISASIYSERQLHGHLVVDQEFDFTVKECHHNRNLRAPAY